jgi:hypothetical protein
VQLGVPTYGRLSRVALSLESGTITGGTLYIYDRKGACQNQLDLNTEASGSAAVADAGGLVQVTTAAPHNLLPGAVIEFKGELRSEYPSLYTVAAIPDATTFVLDTPYVVPANPTGLWQTAPFFPTLNPINHLILVETITATGQLLLPEINRAYQNRDNQVELLRQMTPALWLEYVPQAGSDPAVFQFSFTTQPYAIG